MKKAFCGTAWLPALALVFTACDTSTTPGITNRTVCLTVTSPGDWNGVASTIKGGGDTGYTIVVNGTLCDIGAKRFDYFENTGVDIKE